MIRGYEYSVVGNFGGCPVEPSGSITLSSLKMAKEIAVDRFPDGGYTIWRRRHNGGWEIFQRMEDICRGA
jgi:hypothetical protein